LTDRACRRRRPKARIESEGLGCADDPTIVGDAYVDRLAPIGRVRARTRATSLNLFDRSLDAYESVLEALPRDDADRDLRVREARPNAAEFPGALTGASARTRDQQPLGDAIPGGLYAEPAYRTAAVRSEIVVVGLSDNGARGRESPEFAQLALSARQETLE
jgi:hypothetical protein